MSGSQGPMSGTPPRRLPRRSHSPLTACPGPRRAGHGRWRVGTRLRRVLLRWQAPQPWRSRPGTTPAEAVDPTLVGTLVPTRDPTPPTRVPPRLLGDPSPLVMPPSGSGASARQGALRAIDSFRRSRFWRTFGPRRLRRQSQPGSVATQALAAAGAGRSTPHGSADDGSPRGRQGGTDERPLLVRTTSRRREPPDTAPRVDTERLPEWKAPWPGSSRSCTPARL